MSAWHLAFIIVPDALTYFAQVPDNFSEFISFKVFITLLTESANSVSLWLPEVITKLAMTSTYSYYDLKAFW